MAKGHGKAAKTTARKGPPARTSDAEQLAAIRWLVMRIEQLCIELFVTDRDKFAEVEASLRVQVRLLQNMARPQTIGGDDCPDGYVLCRDGLCAPMCDDFDTIAAAKPTKKGKKR